MNSLFMLYDMKRYRRNHFSCYAAVFVYLLNRSPSWRINRRVNSGLSRSILANAFFNPTMACFSYGFAAMTWLLFKTDSTSSFNTLENDESFSSQSDPVDVSTAFSCTVAMTCSSLCTMDGTAIPRIIPSSTDI